MEKTKNMAKATAIVFGMIAGVGMLAAMIALANLAKGLAAILLATIAPIAAVILMIYIVYKILEAKN